MDATETKIINVLSRIRPYLQGHGGDAEFVKYEEGVVFIKMLGACVGCGSIDATLTDCIEALLLEEVPGVIGVEVVNE